MCVYHRSIFVKHLGRQHTRVQTVPEVNEIILVFAAQMFVTRHLSLDLKCHFCNTANIPSVSSRGKRLRNGLGKCANYGGYVRSLAGPGR